MNVQHVADQVNLLVMFVTLWSSLVSIQTHVTQALAMRALRKRKTQALALSTVIGCFDRAFLLAAACVQCVKK